MHTQYCLASWHSVEDETRQHIIDSLKRHKDRKRRTLLQEDDVRGAEDADIEDVERTEQGLGGIANETELGGEGEDRSGEFTVTELPVTGEDIGGITSNWFDSFPAALPGAIRDRLLAQLESFVLNPQIIVSLVRQWSN